MLNVYFMGTESDHLWVLSQYWGVSMNCALTLRPAFYLRVLDVHLFLNVAFVKLD